jgi:hypothetical protein
MGRTGYSHPGRPLISRATYHYRATESAMAAGTRAALVDPTSGTRRPVPMAATFTTPGANAGGDDDWLLVLSS